VQPERWSEQDKVRVPVKFEEQMCKTKPLALLTGRTPEAFFVRLQCHLIG